MDIAFELNTDKKFRALQVNIPLAASGLKQSDFELIEPEEDF